jgi:hypothetical protein
VLCLGHSLQIVVCWKLSPAKAKHTTELHLVDKYAKLLTMARPPLQKCGYRIYLLILVVLVLSCSLC